MEELIPAHIEKELRARGGTWGIYKNSDLSHSGFGHIRCLKYGPDCVNAFPPPRHPDANGEILWRYCLVGTFDAASPVGVIPTTPTPEAPSNG